MKKTSLGALLTPDKKTNERLNKEVTVKKITGIATSDNQVTLKITIESNPISSLFVTDLLGRKINTNYYLESTDAEKILRFDNLNTGQYFLVINYSNKHPYKYFISIVE